jgi:hypothetical protein
VAVIGFLLGAASLFGILLLGAEASFFCATNRSAAVESRVVFDTLEKEPLAMFDTRSLRLVLSLATLLACVACSTTPPAQKSAADDDDSYVPTGSHIKRKVSTGSDRNVGAVNSQDAKDMLLKPTGAPGMPGK